MKIDQTLICQIGAMVLTAVGFVQIAPSSQAASEITTALPALEVVLDHPYALINNGRDILYVSDSIGAIRQFDLATGLMSSIPMKAPSVTESGTLLQVSGQLLVSIPSKCDVEEISPDGSVKVIAGGKHPQQLRPGSFCGSGGDGGQAIDAFFEPDALGMDAEGNMLIIDGTDRRIRKVARHSGIITTLVAPSQLTGIPTRIARNKQGDLYISQVLLGTGRYSILRLNHETGSLSPLDGNSFHGDRAIWSSSEEHRDIFVDPSGENLYAEDIYRIFYIDLKNRKVSLVAGNGKGFGGDGGPATSAQLDLPENIAFDSPGNLYFTDYNNCRIRRIDSTTHVITTVAGKVGPVETTNKLESR